MRRRGERFAAALSHTFSRENMAALFSARSFKEDGISAMSCVLILGIAAGSVALVEALPSTYTAIDISRDQTTSVSGDTAEHLSELGCDVEVYLVAEEGSEDEYVERMLDQYAQASDRVTVEQVDPALHPTFTDQYTSEDVADGSIIVVVDDASRVVSSSDLYTLNYSTFSYEFAGESAITSAIIDLLETVDGENQWTRSTHRQAERLSELIGDLIELARADEPGGVFPHAHAGTTRRGAHRSQSLRGTRCVRDRPPLRAVLSPRPFPRAGHGRLRHRPVHRTIGHRAARWKDPRQKGR